MSQSFTEEQIVKATEAIRQYGSDAAIPNAELRKLAQERLKQMEAQPKPDSTGQEVTRPAVATQTGSDGKTIEVPQDIAGGPVAGDGRPVAGEGEPKPEGDQANQ